MAAFALTKKLWDAQVERTEQLESQLETLRAALAENGIDIDEPETDDADVLLADDDDADDTTVDDDDADTSDNYEAGYYFTSDDTSAIYVDDEGFAYEVAANGKPTENYVTDLDGYDFAGHQSIAKVRARLAAANEEPAPAPTRRRATQAAQAVASANSGGRRTIADLTPDELRGRLTKLGVDPATVIEGLHSRARTFAMRTALKAGQKAKSDGKTGRALTNFVMKAVKAAQEAHAS
jgi:hypothetical protein